MENILLTGLNKIEHEIMIRRYGLREFKGLEMTQREVGAELGIEPKFISRIEKIAIEKFRNRNK